MLGRIPQNRLYPLGLNILKLWPEPNVAGPELQLREHRAGRQADDAAADGARRLSALARLRLTGKYTGQLATVKPTAGTIPGFNDTLQNYPFIYIPRRR